MVYAILVEGKRVMVMQFWSEKTRRIFFDNNKSQEGLEMVDESHEYVREAQSLGEDFPIILYK